MFRIGQMWKYFSVSAVTLSHFNVLCSHPFEIKARAEIKAL